MMQLKLFYPEQATLGTLASIICSDRIFSFAATAMGISTPFPGSLAV